MNFLTCNNEAVRTLLTRHIHDVSSQTNESHNGEKTRSQKKGINLHCALYGFLLASFYKFKFLTFFVSQHNFGGFVIVHLLFNVSWCGPGTKLSQLVLVGLTRREDLCWRSIHRMLRGNRFGFTKYLFFINSFPLLIYQGGSKNLLIFKKH